MTVVLTDKDLLHFERVFPYLAFERKTQPMDTNFAEAGDHYLAFGPKRNDGSRSQLRASKHGRFLSNAYMRSENGMEAVAVRLSARFPDLYLSARINQEGVTLAVWVRRGNRDGSSVGALRLTDAGAEQTLTRWQEEAKRSIQTGWFFCSGHVRAEEEGDGRWWYFAGNFCREYGEEHPDERRRAANERYN